MVFDASDPHDMSIELDAIPCSSIVSLLSCFLVVRQLFRVSLKALSEMICPPAKLSSFGDELIRQVFDCGTVFLAILELP